MLSTQPAHSIVENVATYNEQKELLFDPLSNRPHHNPQSATADSNQPTESPANMLERQTMQTRYETLMLENVKSYVGKEQLKHDLISTLTNLSVNEAKINAAKEAAKAWGDGGPAPSRSSASTVILTPGSEVEIVERGERVLVRPVDDTTKLT